MESTKEETLVEIIYDPDLLAEVINNEIKRRDDAEEDDTFFEEYQKARDPIYELPDDEDEREEAFEEVDRKFFDRLSLGGQIAEVLEDFPLIKENVGLIEIRRAVTREEEEGNISNRHLDTGHKAAIIRFRPECFADPDGFKKVIRHEYMHLHDILDEDFGYNTKRFAANPSEESFIRDRYRTIWDIYINSRLDREGRKDEVDRSGCYKEFEALYLKIDEARRKTIFEKLWEMEKMTHIGMLEFAQDPYKLLRLTGEVTEGDKKQVVLPGSACPLCKFPSYEIVTEISKEAEISIRKEFPNWDAGWACERCLDLYNLKDFERPF